MNRPAAHKVLNSKIIKIMVELWDRVDNYPDVRCQILTGAGV